MAAALALVSASSVESAPNEPLAGSGASGRASISLGPGSVTARDIANNAIQVRHLGRSTIRQINGAGPVRLRPRATAATAGWLYFAEDVDGGALFRSDGSSWTQLTTGRLGRIARNSIDSSRIAPEGINASRLANGAVTSRSMSMDAWRAISSSGPVASRPAATSRPAGSFWFAPDVQGGTLYQNDGFNWVQVTRLGAEANITPGSITSELIADGGVATVDLAAGAVDSTRLLDGAVGTNKIAAGAVTSAKLAAGAIGSSNIAADAIDATHIAANAVDSSEVAADAIGSSELAVDAVGSSEIVVDAVTGSELAADSVGSSEIVADAVDAAEIATDAVGSAELAADSVGSSEIAVDAVTASEIIANGVESAEIAASAVGTSEIADGSIALADIDQAVWDNRIAAGTSAARPAAAAGNASSLYLATDEAGGTLSRSTGAAWQVVGRTRSPQAASFLAGTWTNMPVALTELIAANRARMPLDMSTLTEIRMYTNVSVIGAAASTLCVQYSIDSGTTWFNFNGTSGAACAAGIAAVTVNTLGLRASAWQSIPTAARVEGALVRMVGAGGDAAADPVFNTTGIELR